MTERIDEKDLPQVTASPTDELRAVRAGKSVRVPIVSLPPSAAVQEQIDQIRQIATGSPIPYATFEDLPETEPTDGARIVRVYEDEDPELNGAWAWYPGAEGWVKVPDEVADLALRVTTVEDDTAPAVAAISEAIGDDLITFADGAAQRLGGFKSDATFDAMLTRIRDGAGTEMFSFDALGGDPDRTVFTDANGKIIGLLAPDKLVTTDGMEIYHYEAIGDGRELVVVDSLGRVIYTPEGGGGSSVEVEAARGSRSDLNTRLSQSLTPYGMPRRHYWGEWYLRETRQRLRKLALGESTQLVVASIGDSWTHNGGRWSRPTAETLRDTYGDAGAGYVSFAKSGTTLPNGNVFSNSAVTYTGAWDTSGYFSHSSPDLGSATSASAGDNLAYTITGTPSAVNLFALGGAGEVRYRFNAGSWTTVTLSAMSAQVQVIALTSPAAGVFELEVVSGAPVLYGIDVKSAGDGVRWHKLGATGSRASHWAAVNSAEWCAGLQALAPNLVTIMLATNDQAQYDAATYRGHMQTLISRVKSALPLADILLIAPCENGRANAWPMSTYAGALYELAAANGCAYLDLQYVFGDDFSQYASTSPRAWFNADLIHPEPQTGGRVIADAILRLLIQL